MIMKKIILGIGLILFTKILYAIPPYSVIQVSTNPILVEERIRGRFKIMKSTSSTDYTLSISSTGNIESSGTIKASTITSVGNVYGTNITTMAAAISLLGSSTLYLGLNVTNTNYIELSGSTQTKSGGLILSGDVTSKIFHGDGSQLTGISASAGVVNSTRPLPFVIPDDVMYATYTFNPFGYPQYVVGRSTVYVISIEATIIQGSSVSYIDCTLMESTSTNMAKPFHPIFPPVRLTTATAQGTSYSGIITTAAILYPGNSYSLHITSAPAVGLPGRGLRFWLNRWELNVYP